MRRFISAGLFAVLFGCGGELKEGLFGHTESTLERAEATPLWTKDKGGRSCDATVAGAWMAASGPIISPDFDLTHIDAIADGVWAIGSAKRNSAGHPEVPDSRGYGSLRRIRSDGALGFERPLSVYWDGFVGGLAANEHRAAVTVSYSENAAMLRPASPPNYGLLLVFDRCGEVLRERPLPVWGGVVAIANDDRVAYFDGQPEMYRDAWGRPMSLNVEDADGNLVWRREFSSLPTDGTLFVSALAFDAEGNLVVGGVVSQTLTIERQPIGTPGSPVVLKFGRDGALLWSRALDDAYGQVTDVDVGRSGIVAATVGMRWRGGWWGRQYIPPVCSTPGCGGASVVLFVDSGGNAAGAVQVTGKPSHASQSEFLSDRRMIHTSWRHTPDVPAGSAIPSYVCEVSTVRIINIENRSVESERELPSSCADGFVIRDLDSVGGVVLAGGETFSVDGVIFGDVRPLIFR